MKKTIDDFWSNHFEKENKETSWTYGHFQNLITSKSKLENELIVVEVGVARGGHIRHLLDNFGDNIKELYGVDPYLSGFDETDSFSNKKQKEYDNLFLWVTEKYCKHDKYKHFRDSSVKIIDNFKDNSVDAIYIDGDHTYEGAKSDIEIWLPKLKIGGLIAGDDIYTKHCPGVKKAVEELIPEYKVQMRSNGNKRPTWYWVKK